MQKDCWNNPCPVGRRLPGVCVKFGPVNLAQRSSVGSGSASVNEYVHVAPIRPGIRAWRSPEKLVHWTDFSGSPTAAAYGDLYTFFSAVEFTAGFDHRDHVAAFSHLDSSGYKALRAFTQIVAGDQRRRIVDCNDSN